MYYKFLEVLNLCWGSLVAFSLFTKVTSDKIDCRVLIDDSYLKSFHLTADSYLLKDSYRSMIVLHESAARFSVFTFGR